MTVKWLGQHVVQNASVNISEPEIAPLESERERFVVESKLMEHRGMKIMNVGSVVSGAETQFVRLAELIAFFSAASGKPHGKGINVVVSTGGLPIFSHRCSSKLASPYDERVIKEASLLEVDDEGR